MYARAWAPVPFDLASADRVFASIWAKGEIPVLSSSTIADMFSRRSRRQAYKSMSPGMPSGAHVLLKANGEDIKVVQD